MGPHFYLEALAPLISVKSTGDHLYAHLELIDIQLNFYLRAVQVIELHARIQRF